VDGDAHPGSPWARAAQRGRSMRVQWWLSRTEDRGSDGWWGWAA
jgi:hypothetical protein